MTAGVFVGSDERPRFFSHLGWIDDDPSKPCSLSRDAGRLVLGAGTQGTGKTVLSTVIGEMCVRAYPPLTSAEMLPSCYGFFHIEEQDRLPQLLDGLKKKTKPADLELLKQRLGVSGLPIERMRLCVPRTLLPDLRPRLLPYEDLGLEVLPLKVHLWELGQHGLAGALGCCIPPGWAAEAAGMSR